MKFTSFDQQRSLFSYILHYAAVFSELGPSDKSMQMEDEIRCKLLELAETAFEEGRESVAEEKVSAR